ncbi:MAG TPA: NADPH:quinone reductase [Elusimicrobiota bacterium]|jgi:NADPH2:quinone reductase|nr:NADPH:quinone reductase [Elusimicrobiota bacterium]
MKAIVVRAFGGPEVLRLKDVPAPAPGAGRVLVAVKAIGVNPVEAYIRAGTYPRKPELPYTPGTDAAGVVEAVGTGAAAFKPGDRVYVYALAGAYAEKIDVELSRVFPLPRPLSYEQGAALGVPYATAHRALFHHGGARRGETVLIHGASGGVGAAAVQLALRAGLTVIGTGGGAEGAEFVRSLGARHALDHRAAGYQDEISRLTGGRGVDLVVEMLANANLPADLALLAPRGRIAIVGSRGPVTIDPRALMTKDAAVRGMSLWNMTVEERAEVHADLGRGLADGTLKPAIGALFALADAPRAHEAVMSPGARGKIVMRP